MSEAALPAELPALGPDGPFAPPAVVETVLPNGLTLWTCRRPGLPLVSVQLVVRGGRRDDPASLPGFAGLLAAGLKEGTQQRRSEELGDLFQSAGAELVTGAGDDALIVGVAGLSAKLDVLLDGVADVARHPAFPAGEVARVRTLAREELATNESDPFFLLNRAFRRVLCAGHPYGVVSPSPETIDSLTPESLREEARRRLAPTRTLLLVAGDVGPERVRDLAMRFLGDWAGSGVPPEEAGAVPPPAAGPCRIVRRPGSVQATLAVGGPAPKRKDAGAAAFRIALTIYGAAFSSRLVTNLREEKGYTYSPLVRWSGLPLGGHQRTVAAVRTDVAGAALNEIFYELRRMATTDVTGEELSRAKARDVGALLQELQMNGGVSGQLADLWLHGLSPSALALWVEALRAVDAAAVRHAARLWLATPSPAIVAVGEEALLLEELAPFGA